MSTVQVDGDADIYVELRDESPNINVTIQGAGPRGAQGPAGQDGADGADGEDGYSPTVSVEEITGGHRVTITDKDGDQVFDVMDGQGGGGGTSDYDDLTDKPQINGNTLSGNKSTSDLGLDQIFWATYGTTTYSEIASAVTAGKLVACIYSNHIYQLSGMSAANLQVAEFSAVIGQRKNGWLKCTGSTWTNGTVRVAPEEETVSSAGDVTKALDAGKVYHFTGALTSLTLTLTAPDSGNPAQYHFDFNSGSTAPTVTVTGATWPGGSFTPEASKHYEVDILDGYAVVQSW